MLPVRHQSPPHEDKGMRFTGQGHYQRLLTGSALFNSRMVAAEQSGCELKQVTKGLLTFSIQGFAATQCIASPFLMRARV